MLLRAVISFGFLAIANGQSPNVSIVTERGSVPVQGDILTLTCNQSPACGLPLQWKFVNTSNTNVIWSGTVLSPLGSSLGVSVICPDVYDNCNLTMTAEKDKHDGDWFCTCTPLTNFVTVDINVLVSNVLLDSPDTRDVETNLTCKTNCAYPTAKITWSSSQGIVQNTVQHWGIPCNDSGLVASYSTYTVKKTKKKDNISCSAAQNGFIAVVSKAIIVGGPLLSVLQIIMIVVGCVIIIAIGIGGTICICRYKGSKGKNIGEVIVVGIEPSGEKGVAIRVKSAGSKEDKVKAGIVQVTWPNGKQSEAKVVEETVDGGIKIGVLLVEGTRPNGKKYDVVVVKLSRVNRAENDRFEIQQAWLNGSLTGDIVVNGKGPNGKTTRALVVKITWPDGAEGEAVVIKDTVTKEMYVNAESVIETDPSVAHQGEKIIVVGTRRDKEVTVVAKGKGPSRKTAEAKSVKVYWPNEKQYEAFVVEKTMPDGTVGGALVVKGIGQNGEKGEAVVVKVAQTAVESIETALRVSNQTALVVKGTTQTGKKAKALVVRVTWPSGAEGNAVVVKGTEPDVAQLGPLRVRGTGPNGGSGEAMFVKGKGTNGGQGDAVVFKPNGSNQNFCKDPRPDYST